MEVNRDANNPEKSTSRGNFTINLNSIADFPENQKKLIHFRRNCYDRLVHYTKIEILFQNVL